MPTLKQVLPKEFAQGGYASTPAYAFRDVAIVARKLASGAPCASPSKSDLFESWPGPEAHVRDWFVLENGKAVAINEDPAGVTFPVVDYES